MPLEAARKEGGEEAMGSYGGRGRLSGSGGRDARRMYMKAYTGTWMRLFRDQGGFIVYIWRVASSMEMEAYLFVFL